MKTLHLTLKKEPFEVMVTGEKKWELRSPSAWIESRLLKKNGRYREYDFVKFTQGYGKSRPFFIAKFEFTSAVMYANPFDFTFSNGLVVTQHQGDYKINLGEITEIGNYKIKDEE